MSKKSNLYLGKAGELAAMSYFLMRGWNVATPEVDVGDDIFVIEDNKGVFHRVQVKTAKAVERKNGYSVQFHLPLAQLEKRIQPEIHLLRGELPNRIYPNGHKVASIYNIDDFIRSNNQNIKGRDCTWNPYGMCNPCSQIPAIPCTPCDKLCDENEGSGGDVCCDRIMNKMQFCYNVADAGLLVASIACGFSCSFLIEFPPAAYTCLLACETGAGIAYGAGLDYCTADGDVGALSCNPPCW